MESEVCAYLPNEQGQSSLKYREDLSLILLSGQDFTILAEIPEYMTLAYGDSTPCGPGVANQQPEN